MKSRDLHPGEQTENHLTEPLRTEASSCTALADDVSEEGSNDAELSSKQHLHPYWEKRLQSPKT